MRIDLHVQVVQDRKTKTILRQESGGRSLKAVFLFDHRPTSSPFCSRCFAEGFQEGLKILLNLPSVPVTSYVMC